MGHACFSRQQDGTYHVIDATTREVFARELSLLEATQWVRDLRSGRKKRGNEKT